ncbi:hypothetical protein [Capnocytophaga sp.]|uniref:hypothetical protein n=1 Tax=Capnocytophaga sp. TaxID=44737 RepID=UPI0026DC7579|nr:hypothetical protein [Capnocytophaga sp.]MDO5104327.1 hypothetical protein [Capnocytophaga sp.]
MKKNFIWAMLLLVIVACRKSDPDVNPPAPIDPNAFGMSISNIYNDPIKNLTNIQVGDYIPYSVEITDTQDNATYSLLLIKEGEKYHQTLGKDYELYIDNEKGEKQKLEVLKNDKVNYVIFNKKGKHYFYVKPLLPGTFKLVYELQKQIDGKPIGNTNKQETLFNAVKIKLWVVTEETRNFPLITKRNFYFEIDDGKDEADTYLTSDNQMSQSYLLTYDGKDYTGEFNQGAIRFIVDRKDQWRQKLDVLFVNRIFITQSRANKQQDIIEYHNVGNLVEEIKKMNP